MKQRIELEEKEMRRGTVGARTWSVVGAMLLTLLMSGCSEEQVNVGSGASVDSETSVDSGTANTEEVVHEDGVFRWTFEGETMGGTGLSSAIFSEYDVTMVNVWATWCGACVNEMPYLQELYGVLPEGVHFFSLLTDGDSQGELAKKIMEGTGATYETLLLNEGIESGLMPYVKAYPTTFFFDSEGRVLEEMKGAPSADVVEVYLRVLASVMASMEEEG